MDRFVWPEQLFTAENMTWNDGAKTITRGLAVNI
jgi:hypothetical protein